MDEIAEGSLSAFIMFYMEEKLFKLLYIIDSFLFRQKTY